MLAQSNSSQAQSGAQQSHRSTNIMDTDVGELLKVPCNPRWKEFLVQKPMKNNDYVTYEILGYDMKGSF